jgi:D-alanyl-D-alanine carboxypeptidase (penicillin-binding protein 5/6)
VRARRQPFTPSTPTVVPIASADTISTAWTHRKPVGLPPSHARGSSQIALANRGHTAQLHTATATRKADQRRVRNTVTIILRRRTSRSGGLGRGRLRRAALLVTAVCCALGAVAVGVAPGATAATPAPIGGKAMGTSGTLRTSGSPAIPASVKSRAFVVADLTTGTVLAARKPHYKLAPASTLKTLTALTILRNVPLDRKVRMTRTVPVPECACVGLTRWRYYRVDALLNALIMRSGNDVAELLATSTGSRARTMTLMNNTLRDLRAGDSRAVTPSGLDGRGQSLSAYDLALVNRAAFADARFRKIMATKTFRFGPVGGPTRTLIAQNELWHMGYAGQLGSKNGWTRKAQQTFVAVARRGSRTLVVTLLYNDRGIAKQAATLLDWGFRLPAAAKGIGALVPARSAPTPTPKPTVTPTPTATPTAGATTTTAVRKAAVAPTRTAGPAVPPTATATPTPSPVGTLPMQASLSLGAIGFAGLALLPGRRPGRRNGTRRRASDQRGGITR